MANENLPAKIVIHQRHHGRYPNADACRCGLEIPEFWGTQVSEGEMHLIVRKEHVKIPFTIHALRVGEVEYKRTFVTKMNVEVQQSSQSGRLPWGGFGQMLFLDYAEASELAFREWLDSQPGYKFCSVYNHWPTFQMCFEITKPDSEKSAELRLDRKTPTKKYTIEKDFDGDNNGL